MKIILASASPRRKSLMRKAGYRFSIIPSHTSERIPKKMGPHDIVKYLALKKAKDVSRQNPDAIVLGADTLVSVRGEVIGKPKNKKHAEEILRKLSGVWQKVYTGVAVAKEGGKRTKVRYAVSKVKIRPLSDNDISRACRNHLDKAGAYAIQQRNDPFVEKIVGDYDNVVGLPMRVVKRLLDFPF